MWRSLSLASPPANPGRAASCELQRRPLHGVGRGGVGGRRLVLNALDDEFNPQKAAENARKLADAKATVLFNCWGTSNCSAIMPVISEVGLPMFAGIAGGGPMRQAPGRWAFNVRPTTDQEIARMVGQMSSIGQTDIAVVYQNDPFGMGRYACWVDSTYSRFEGRKECRSSCPKKPKKPKKQPTAPIGPAPPGPYPLPLPPPPPIPTCGFVDCVDNDVCCKAGSEMVCCAICCAKGGGCGSSDSDCM